MKSVLKSLVLAAALGLATAAQASLVAYWNFNELSISTASVPGSGGVPLTIAANSGSGTLSLAGWAGTVDDFAGTTLNALFGDPAEESLSLISGGPSGGPYPGNGSYIQLSFSMTGLQSLEISFATRGTSTGFDTGQWSWSTDGITFTNFGPNTATRNTTFEVVQFSTSALDNAATAFLRYTLSGATGNSGNNRIDNLQLNAVPEPAAIAALLGLAALGVVLYRRRAA